MASDFYVKANSSKPIIYGSAVVAGNGPSGVYQGQAQSVSSLDHEATRLDTRFDDVSYY